MVEGLNLLERMIADLRQKFGSQNWWPAESPFEVMVGAILTQNTSWTNVEKAIVNLKAAEALDPQRIMQISDDELEELIRPSGFFRQKARRLKIFVAWYLDSCDDDLEILKKTDTELLRAELLNLWGIGPETADAILLYALDKPVFVVDAYTTRVFSRHGLVEAKAPYNDVQVYAQAHLKPEVSLYNEAHALIVQVGKHFCFRQKPDCENCPLMKYFPEGISPPTQ